MKLYKVDTLIKNSLFGKQLSIHHYGRRAYLAMQFIRTLNFDAAWTVKTTVLTITANKIALPADYVGVSRLGIQNGQYLEELAPNNKLFNNDEDPAEAEYGDAYWYPNINKYGENLGGYFGYGLTNPNSYKVLPSENKILIGNDVAAGFDTIVLEYVTDGLESGRQDTNDPEPSIIYMHPYATDAMYAYIEWQLPVSNRLSNQNSERHYYNELRKARARLNPITATMIKRSLRKNYGAHPKN